MFILTLVAFLIILGLLVFVHEFGHFSMAKICGVTVEEFAFGFPPRLVCRKKNGTRYCINLIPFGGYVTMLGEDEDVKTKGSFSGKKARFRFLIVVAGVLMNFILAGVLFSAGYMIGMSPIAIPESALSSGVKSNKIIIAQVMKGSAGEKAGLQVGDSVLNYNDIGVFADFTKSNLNQDITVTIQRANEVLNKQVHVSGNIDAPVGLGLVDAPSYKLPFFQAIGAGFEEMIFTTGAISKGIYSLFKDLFSTGKVGEGVAGPIGIFNITGEAVRLGISYLVQLAGLLSINLALINILPFPALDGGRAILIFAEGIARKKVIKAEVESLLHTIGFVILIALILVVTFKEVLALV
jgi:regulator of sigma E protease